MKKYLSRLLALVLALVLLALPASALTVDQALELLEEYYYYDIPGEAYEAGSVEELIRLLGDPYTSYMSPEAYQAFLESMEGETDLVGIGVSMQYTDEGILVVEVIPGGSAQGAGFQPGDLIVEVDGTSCAPADASHREMIIGEEDTQVTLTILRDGKTSTHTLTRRPVVVPNTQIRLLDGGIGYIDCNSFGLDTGREFAALVKDNDRGVNLWVVDVRGNGGGYVNAAMDMLSALMGPGRYLYTEYGDGSGEYVAGMQRSATAKPVILLTDGNSASASEIVASNIRDRHWGITVGSRTYGKGVAQVMLDGDVFPDYFEGGSSLKVTTYRFYSAGGNTTDKIGVIPTLLVDSDKVEDVALALGNVDGMSRMMISFDSPDRSRVMAYYISREADEETLSALLSALPPQAHLGYRATGWAVGMYTPAQLAEILGIEYENRWFDDVADSRYADAINAMGTYRLLVGDGQGSFNPKGQLTRAELCVMLARVLDVGYQGPSLFQDVDMGIWYGPSVNALAYLGLVNGVGDGKFNPNGTLTQEEFLTIMGRSARFINVKLDDYGQWAEDGTHFALYQKLLLSPYSEWARGSVAVLAWGLEDALDGRGDMLYAPLKDLSPQQPILREEAAAGMYAVLSGLNILP
ncbi:MAG: S-layer homology domain-containing protein [Oscillospiraceae bacterium]|nr:S-layer homology domain-containing protein [Oscillospiraceae bacterium]